jgi:hypothetical protein
VLIRTNRVLLLTVLLPLCGTADTFSVFVLPSDDSYLASTALYAVTDPDFTNLAALNGPLGTITFSNTVQTRTVPDSWATWNDPPAVESSTPRVLFANNGSTLDLTFPEPFLTFGFEAEPETTAVQNITATFFRQGTTLGTISYQVDGDGGAVLFAASTNVGFTSVSISTDDIGFGMAQLRASVPEPRSLLLMLGAIAAALGLHARRASRNPHDVS